MEHRHRRSKITASKIETLADSATVAFIFCLPFLMLHWMLPFVSDVTIGNDYIDYPIDHQLELMFALKTGSFPLYIPGFAGGQTASALTLGQLFHPISHLSSWLPGYWNGKALEFNTLFRLLSLGLAHLMLFRLLKKLNIDFILAFVFSFMTVYNLRMLDLFRYGASLESWTGHLYLCTAIAFYYLKPTRWKGPLFIISATYWLICSGHPQMMYYGLLGAGLFAIVFPFFANAVLPDCQMDAQTIYRFYLRIILFCAVGFLLSCAYIIPFYFDYVIHSAGRIARDYAWADVGRDSLMGTINSFFNPLRSDVHGVFGGSSLILVAVLIPVLKLIRVKVPLVIWIIWGLLALAFLHMQGSRAPIHFIVWKFLPLASSFRIAGRISMIMPVLFMLLLTWLVGLETIRLKWLNHQIVLKPRTILAGLALLIIAGYLLMPASMVQSTNIYSATVIRQIPPWLELTAILCGMAALALLAVHGCFDRLKHSGQMLLLLFVGLQMVLLLQYGTWLEKKKITPTLTQTYQAKKEGLDYHASIGYGLANAVIMRQTQRSFLEPFLGKIYRRYRIAENNDMAYDLMQQDQSPDQITIEQYARQQTLAIKTTFNQTDINAAKLVYSSFNRLIFELQNAEAAFFGLAVPYTGHWCAYLNGQRAEVYRANGAYHAVEVPAGSSRLEFRYWSWAAFWGMVISCGTLLFCGGMAGFKAARSPLNVLLALTICLLVMGGFGYWWRSLYRGDDLQTAYSWTDASIAAKANIAYGKRTFMSSLLFSNYPYQRSSAQAVDGEVTPKSGFVTGLGSRPWWVVDLHRLRSIGYIVLYEGVHHSQFNARPLTIAFSNDRKSWRTMETISDTGDNRPYVIQLKPPQKTRYVLIRSSGTCHLSFDEIEIYAPKNTPVLNP